MLQNPRKTKNKEECIKHDILDKIEQTRVVQSGGGKKKRLGNKHLYIERTTAWEKDMLLGQEEI